MFAAAEAAGWSAGSDDVGYELRAVWVSVRETLESLQAEE
jgi:hypothetical protein